MNHVPDDVLAALALGETEVDPADRGHVDGCPVCSLEVAELAQVDILMREEAGLTGPVRVEPSAQVWRRITEATVDPPSHDVVALDDRREPPPVRRRAGWLIAAAVACVLAGALVGRALWNSSADTSSQVLATVPLTTLDASRQKEGTAELLDARGVQQLRVDATSVPSGSGYVEVWLINADGKRMVSLGVLSAPDSVFPVPAGAIAQGYTTVDLSREQFDDKPQHSGDSIMRGTLPA